MVQHYNLYNNYLLSNNCNSWKNQFKSFVVTKEENKLQNSYLVVFETLKLKNFKNYISLFSTIITTNNNYLFYFYYYKKKYNNRINKLKKYLFNNNNNINLQVVKWKFAKYYFIGLGYKVFVRNRFLYIWIGLTHYTLIKIPKTVFVFAKKKRFYILSMSELDFKIILAFIRNIKNADIYKGKGLLEVKSYKNFIKMKTGKKKQY